MVLTMEINNYLPQANGQPSMAGAIAWGVRGVSIHLETSTTTTESVSTSHTDIAFMDVQQVARRRSIAALAMRGVPRPPARDSWRRTVGRFEGDAEMQAIWEAGRRIREADRLP